MLDERSAWGTIAFDASIFPPTSPQTMTLLSALPVVSRGNLTIDASNAGVILDGSATPAGTNGFNITSSGNVIRGMQILRFPGHGIYISGGAQNNTIGGTRTVGDGATGQGNLISGNGADGIQINGSSTMSNTVSGNNIGTDVNGTVALGNRYDGVRLENGTHNNTVGGSAPGERNVVSGNNWSGISAGGGATENIIIGNYVGTDANGMMAVGNGQASSQAGTALYGDAHHNDTFGRIHITDATSKTTILSPDEQGRPTRLQDAAGRELAQQYDADANLAALTDPAGKAYAFDYDRQGNVIGSENPLGQQIKLDYDYRFNQITSLQDGRGNRTGFSYNSTGNMIATTYPDGSREQFAYDAAGNLTRFTARNGSTITYTYTSKGQLQRKDYPNGSWTAYTYDAAGNLTSASDVSGTIAMEYDAATNRLTRITYPSGHWFTFTYDGSGRRTKRVGDDGYTLNYSYDTAGRLYRLTDGANAVIIRYEYDSAGRLVKETKGNGTYTTYEYDAAGQILHLVNYAPGGAVQSRFDYTYDSNGNCTSMTTLAGTTAYEYDVIGQLTGVTYPGGRRVTYAYDEAGNRTVVTDNGAATTYTTNDLNQYTQVGAATYTYDANGNMTSKSDSSGTTTYAYDFENRLVRVTTPVSGTWEYTYDALGNRVAVSHDGAVTRYVHDPIGLVDVAAEYGSGGALAARYVHGPGLVARADVSGNTSYYAFDGTGQTRQLSDGNGVVLNVYDYDVFGATVQVGESIPNPFRYAGRHGVVEDGNGLNLMRARFFRPELGRFISQDPIGLVGGDVNLYTFCYNSPVLCTDPLGTSLLKWAGRLVDTASLVATMVTRKVATVLQQAPISFLGQQVLTGGFYRAETLTALSKVKAGLGRLSAPLSIWEAGKAWHKYVYYTCPAWVAQKASFWDLVHDGAIAWGKTAFLNVPFAQDAIDIIDKITSEAITSDDPNEKVGPAGRGPQHAVQIGDELHYTVYFENQPTASAPAQEVFVTDYLDPDLDWGTLRLTEISWGDQVVAIPENTGEFYTRRTVGDYRPGAQPSWWADVRVTVDYASGRVLWTLRTLDPQTGELPLDPWAGLLLPNDSTGRGEGHVSFTVRPRAGLAEGTSITNKASIVFDTNEPIVTNEVTNVIGWFKLYLPLVLRGP